MPLSFWTSYGVALATVAGMLALLSLVARYAEVRRARGRHSGCYVAVLESTALTPQASLHVVRFGDEVMLVGVAANAISRVATVEKQPRST